MKIRYLLLTVLASVSVNATLRDTLHSIQAHAAFFPSLIGNWIKYDDLFNYNRIAGDQGGQADKVYVALDDEGNIVALHDGKKVPLMLASIPMSTDDFNRLRKDLGLNIDAHLNIFSLNQKWERKWSGLKKAIKKDANAYLHKYPTIDFTAPTLIDIIRIVRDILNRDNTEAAVVVVHCKSGRGRSATAMAAYLEVVLFQAGFDLSIDQIEAYMIARRQQVKLNAKHRAAFAQFKNELREAGSFDALLHKYADEIKARDVEVKKL